ncbi:MAG: hypothetical protein Q8N99_01540 [Nanoarchaeota archaeon]|nr:hypothetical protein [Nanoarchaeota archaeon]
MLLEIFNFMHFIGLAFGLGGATIASVISSKAMKDEEIRKVMGKIMLPIVKLIWAGLILLIISGIFIAFLVTWPLNKNLLIIKHFLVAWIIIIGIIIGKRMKNKKDIKGLSKLNLILWYAVTLISAFV